MKFSLKPTPSGRVGVITNIARLPNFEMETPHALLFTKTGTIPYITHEILRMFTNENLGILIPLPHVAHLHERIKLCDHTISDFIGLQDCMSYCSFINPAEKRIPGYHEKLEISMWTRRGRKKFSAQSYMEIMEYLKPDLFTTLADGDTDKESTQKRVKKAVDCSVEIFEKCLELCTKSKILETNQMIGVIEGGFNETLREECSKVVGESPVVGVVIDGLHDYSKAVSEMKTDDIIPVLKASLRHIPDDKLRIIHGCWNPCAVLDLIDVGIDLFDSTYPYFVTEEFGALIFPLNEDGGDESQLKSNDSDSEETEPAAKKIKLVPNSKYYISMKDPKYLTDFSPILKNCSCLTCKSHSKAYVHHLVKVKELLGTTLLMIHNVHHYLEFLSTARKAIQAGTFQKMKRSFQSWVNGVDDTSPSD